MQQSTQKVFTDASQVKNATENGVVREKCTSSPKNKQMSTQ